ncbi:MAG TPA: hypothetical protein P5079_11065, partial [Elusimicrobiota bacterium]|nr:hypothetical protein [Elusimicrobiota bacterium]
VLFLLLPAKKRRVVAEFMSNFYLFATYGWIAVLGGSTAASGPLFLLGFYVVFKIFFLLARRYQEGVFLFVSNRVSSASTKVLSTKLGGKFLQPWKTRMDTARALIALEESEEGTPRPSLWKLAFPTMVAGFATFFLRIGYAFGKAHWEKHTGTSDLEKDVFLGLHESNTFPKLSAAAEAGLRRGFVTYNVWLNAAGQPTLTDEEIREALAPLAGRPDNFDDISKAIMEVERRMDVITARVFGRLNLSETDPDALQAPFTPKMFQGLTAEFLKPMPNNNTDFIVQARSAVEMLLSRQSQLIKDMSKNVLDNIGREAQTLPRFNDAAMHRYLSLAVLSYQHNLRPQLQFVSQGDPELQRLAGAVDQAQNGLLTAKTPPDILLRLKDLSSRLDDFFKTLERKQLLDPRGAFRAPSIRFNAGNIRSLIETNLPSDTADPENLRPDLLFRTYQTIESLSEKSLAEYVKHGIAGGFEPETMFVDYKGALLRETPAQISTAFEQRILPVLHLLSQDNTFQARMKAIETDLAALKQLSARGGRGELTPAESKLMADRVQHLATSTEQLLADAFEKREKLIMGDKMKGLVPGHPYEELLKSSTFFRQGHLSARVRELLTPEHGSREGIRSGYLLNAYRELEVVTQQAMNSYIRVQITDVGELTSKILEYKIRERNWTDYITTLGFTTGNYFLGKLGLTVDQGWVESLFQEKGDVGPFVLRMRVIHQHLLTPNIYLLSGGDQALTQEFAKMFDDIFRGKDVVNKPGELQKALEEYFTRMDRINAALPGVQRHGEAIQEITLMNKRLAMDRNSQLVGLSRDYANAGAQYYFNQRQDGLRQQMIDQRAERASSANDYARQLHDMNEQINSQKRENRIMDLYHRGGTASEGTALYEQYQLLKNLQNQGLSSFEIYRRIWPDDSLSQPTAFTPTAYSDSTTLPNRTPLGVRQEFVTPLWRSFLYGVSFFKDPKRVGTMQSAYLSAIQHMQSEFSQTIENRSIRDPLGLGLSEPQLMAAAVSSPKDVLPVINGLRTQHANILEEARRVTADPAGFKKYEDAVARL